MLTKESKEERKYNLKIDKFITNFNIFDIFIFFIYIFFLNFFGIKQNAIDFLSLELSYLILIISLYDTS